MKEELLKKIVSADESQPDNLVVGTLPALRIGSGIVRKGTGVLKRGTILAKSSVDAKLVPLGTAASGDEKLEAYGILTDDIDVSKDDVPSTIYISGMFNTNKLIVNKGYTITEIDKDTLRKYGIEFKAALTN